jgi:hypothetical protein
MEYNQAQILTYLWWNIAQHRKTLPNLVTTWAKVKSRLADTYNSASVTKTQEGVSGPRPKLYTKEDHTEYAQPKNESLPVEWHMKDWPFVPIIKQWGQKEEEEA